MFLWAIKVSGSNIARMTSLSKPTGIRALSDLRMVCSNKIVNADIKIRGVGKTVEIDESKFGAKGKYRRGRVLEGLYVFGAVERDHKKHYSSVFPTVPETQLPTAWSPHIFNLEPLSTLTSLLRTSHLTSSDTFTYQWIIRRTLLILTAWHHRRLVGFIEEKA